MALQGGASTSAHGISGNPRAFVTVNTTVSYGSETGHPTPPHSFQSFIAGFAAGCPLLAITGRSYTPQMALVSSCRGHRVAALGRERPTDMLHDDVLDIVIRVRIIN